MTFRIALSAAIAAFSLASCDDVGMTGRSEAVRTGSSTAENACMTAVNVNMPGSTSAVLGSDSSGAASVVMLRSSDGTNWRCVVSNQGVVRDLAVV